MIRVLKTHAKRPKKSEIDDFRVRYTSPLSNLSDEVFEEIKLELEAAISETKALDQQASTAHHGYQFNKLLEVLNELLTKHSVSMPSSAKNELF
jgi:hypothetical protein